MTKVKKSEIEKITASHCKMSARLLIEFSELYLSTEQDLDENSAKEFVLIHDLFIKAKSFKFLSSAGFLTCCLLVLLIVLFPIISEFKLTLLSKINLASVQTALIGALAVAGSIHLQYKKRQSAIESIMRTIIYRDREKEIDIKSILKKVKELDQGFDFKEDK